MYNLIVLASKPSAWTHEHFIEWWRGEHAEVTYPLLLPERPQKIGLVLPRVPRSEQPIAPRRLVVLHPRIMSGRDGDGVPRAGAGEDRPEL